METLKGEVVKVFTSNEGWFAGRFKPDGGVACGIAGMSTAIPADGAKCELIGEWKDHAKYGKQFKFTSIAIEPPSTREGVERYLMRFDGIGPTTAKKIVAALGEDAPEKIRKEPHLLNQFRRLRKVHHEEIVSGLEELKGGKEHRFILLHQMSLGPKTIENVIEHFGSDEALDKALSENPYRLVEVQRLSFTIVDNALMAMSLFKPDSPYRGFAAVVQALKEAMNDGHTFLRAEAVREGIQKLRLHIAIPPDAIKLGVIYGVKEGIFEHCYEDDARGLALGWLAAHERLIADRISKLTREKVGLKSDAIIKASLMTREQFDALTLAMTEGFSILTGGPGTGKTYTETGIIQALGKGDTQVLAPTGKAAKRASEVTGTQAMTIHRYVGELDRGEREPDDNLIIDEASMLSVEVFAMLLKKWEGKRIVLIGDKDQLPAVGAGFILGDLIASETVPVTNLTKIHRQAEGSTIIRNAHAINAGSKDIPDVFGMAHDWRFHGAATADKAEAEGLGVISLASLVLEEYGKEAERVGGGEAMYFDIQVLTGQKGGPLGVHALNQALRNEFNRARPGASEFVLPHGEVLFREGDKVICTSNDYGLGVVNGDIGIVRHCERSKDKRIVTIQLTDGRRIDFIGDDTFKLQLAWAMTVHKSQGSEYRSVIVICHESNYWALQRQLLYTGVTRASEVLVLVGTHKAVRIAISNNKPAIRFTQLRDMTRARRLSVAMEGAVT